MNIVAWILWPVVNERLDVFARGLLLRVMGVASRSRTAFPSAEVSLRREAALARELTPSSVHVFNEKYVFLDDMGVHSRGDVPRARI